MYIYVCYMHTQYHSVQLNSVTQSCLTLCDPMNHSTPGLPVHHQLPEFTQTHAHRVGDAIQPSHPLSSPSPPAPKPSQHQGFSNESTFRTISLIYTKKTGATGYLWKKYFVLFVLPMPRIISWIFSYKFKVLIKQTSLMKALFPLISLSWVHALFPLCMKWVAKCEAGWDDK